MSMRRRQLSLGIEPPAIWLGIVATIAAVAVGTLIVYPLKSVAPVVSLGVVYLPAILLISTVWGLRLGLFASIASAAAFNFFQIPPLHRFTIAEEENWVALIAFVIAAVVSSTVAGLARADLGPGGGAGGDSAASPHLPRHRARGDGPAGAAGPGA